MARESVSQAWHDQAARSLDAMHKRAEAAEAERDALREEVSNLLGLMGWGGPLKISYGGESLSDFEDSLHELARLSNH